jgi:hypothetical protein
MAGFDVRTGVCLPLYSLQNTPTALTQALLGLATGQATSLSASAKLGYVGHSPIAGPCAVFKHWVVSYFILHTSLKIGRNCLNRTGRNTLLTDNAARSRKVEFKVFWVESQGFCGTDAST